MFSRFVVGSTTSKYLRANRSLSSLSGTTALQDTDPEIFNLLVLEKTRQRETINLIASENFSSCAVAETNASCLNNKMTEGYPGARYYGGSYVLDKIERLCKSRALSLFGLSKSEWAVNVQSLSGSPANLQAYSALIKPHERVMALELSHGGHLTHGFMTPKKKVSASSLFFEFMHYKLNENTMLIDYDELSWTANLFKPKIIVAGTSCYSRLIDYARFRQICDQVGAYLMVDMAHISGLVAANVIPSPFPYADIVTSTTHKTLRGPRSGIIFTRKTEELPSAVDFSVFPSFQGAPHMHIVGALSVALKEAMSPEFKEYQKQVVSNSQELASCLQSLNYSILTGGTDNHLMLVDLRPMSLNGNRAQIICEQVGIVLNKNTCPYDSNPTVPGGVRIGTSAVTSRGLGTGDMKQIAEFLHQAFSIGLRVTADNKKLSEFIQQIKQDGEVEALANRVKEYITPFGTPGHPNI